MIYDVSADLTYRFAEPCEVLLLIEAADAPGQSVLSEALSIVYRLLKENSNKVKVLATVLPQMATPRSTGTLPVGTGLFCVDLPRTARQLVFPVAVPDRLLGRVDCHPAVSAPSHGRVVQVPARLCPGAPRARRAVD